MPGLTAADGLFAALPALLAPVAEEAAIGLAVSGGPDSLALMLLVARWARGLAKPPRVFVYSVDHGLRPEAAAEAVFVVDEAARLGFSGRALRWQGEKPSTGVQAAARAARYRLIGEAMRADGVGVLLTAHHARDQSETVLMRLAHGSGFDGLGGMAMFAEVEGVRVFRPLLGAAPETLSGVVADAGLMPIADPSNDDRHYERVRWRQALPQLASLGLTDRRLGQFARRAGEADAATELWAADRFAALVSMDPLGAASLPAPALAALPNAVATKLLARLLDRVGGGQKPRSLGTVERLRDQLSATDFAGATALGVAVRQRGATLWFSREAGRHPERPADIGPAASLLWDRRFRIANRSAMPLSIRTAGALSRAGAERLIGRSIVAPAAAIRSAPLIMTAEGQAVALGCYRLSERVDVEFLGGAAELPQS